MVDKTPEGLHRRVAGWHDIRMDGMSDLLLRARGISVFDVGCNRGMVGFEFACNGATKVHGCDNYERGIGHAREMFADIRSVDSRFEAVDLTKPGALKPFEGERYDLTLCLATFHKLKRLMDVEPLMKQLGGWTDRWFAWRGTSDKWLENEGEMAQLDSWLGDLGFRRVQTSMLSRELGLCAVWERR